MSVHSNIHHIRIKPLKTLIIFYAVAILTPIITSYYLIIPVVLAALLFVITAPAFANTVAKSGLVRTGFMFFIISVLYRIVGISTAEWGNYGNRFLAFSAVWVCYYVWNYMEEKDRERILLFVLIIITVNLIDQIRLSFLYPDYNMHFTEYMVQLYGKINKGSTAFTYCAYFAAMCIFIRIRQKVKLYENVLTILILICIFALFTYYILIIGRSTTVVLCYLANIVFLIAYDRKGSINTRVAIIVALWIFIFFGVIFKSQLIDLIINLFANIIDTKIIVRLEALKNINTDSDGIDYLIRFNLIEIDIKSWLKNPITFLFGNGLHIFSAQKMSVISAAEFTGAGNHSGFFDYIARYGIIGIVFVFQIIRNIYKGLYNYNKTVKYMAIDIFFAFIIFNHTLNSIASANIIFTTFLLVPNLYYLYVKKQNKGADIT